MLTKKDLKMIEEMLESRFSYYTKEIIELFTATNERIDNVNENLSKKIDVLIIKIDEHQGDINNHERRIEKIEEEVIKSSN